MITSNTLTLLVSSGLDSSLMTPRSANSVTGVVTAFDVLLPVTGSRRCDTTDAVLVMGTALAVGRTRATKSKRRLVFGARVPVTVQSTLSLVTSPAAQEPPEAVALRTKRTSIGSGSVAETPVVSAGPLLVIKSV